MRLPKCMSLCSIRKSEGGKMTTKCENSVFGGPFRAWKRSRLGDVLLGGRVVSMHTYDGGGIFQATLTAFL